MPVGEAAGKRLNDDGTAPSRPVRDDAAPGRLVAIAADAVIPSGIPDALGEHDGTVEV